MNHQSNSDVVLSLIGRPDAHDVINTLDLTFADIQTLIQHVSSTLHSNPLHALQISELTLVASRQVDDELAQIFGLWLHAAVLVEVSRPADSLKINRQIIDLLLPRQEWGRIALVRSNMVATLRELGRFEEALAEAQQVKVECARAGQSADKHLPAINLSIANIYHNMGAFAQALQYAQEGYAQATKLNILDILAQLRSLSGALLYELNQYDEARKSLHEALELTKGTEDKALLSVIYLRLGNLEQQLGNYQLALTHLETSRRLKVELGIDSEIAYIDYLRATVYFQLNLLPETVKLCSDAQRAIAGESLITIAAETSLTKGSALIRMGRFDAAVGVLRKAEQQLQEIGRYYFLALVRLQLGLAMLQQDKVSNALDLGNNVLAYAESADSPSLRAQAHILVTQCRIAQGQSDAAKAQLALAQRLVGQFNLNEIAILADYLAGLLHQPTDLSAAYTSFAKAVSGITHHYANLLNDELRISYLNDKVHILSAYVTATHLQVAQQQLPLAELLNAIDHSHVTPTRHIDPSGGGALSSADQARLHKLRTGWNWFQAKIDAAGHNHVRQQDGTILEGESETYKQLQQLEHEIADLLRRQQLDSTSAHVVTPETQHANALQHQIQSRLSADEALLLLYTADNQCHMLLVTASDIQLIPQLEKVDTITELLTAWRFYIQSIVPVQTNPSALHAKMYLHRLYSQLLQPLAAQIEAFSHLYFVLPTQWHDLPVTALYDGSRYLIEAFEITMLSTPSAFVRSFASGGRATTTPHHALIVGYSDNGRLPKTLSESQAIQSRFSADEEKNYLEESMATTESFEIACKKATIIHLATHAVFRPDNPLFSWIRFADKHLAVVDLYNMAFPCKPLIVLSACDSGQGIAKGGGVLGMGRGLLAAGASEAILSRWMLEDEASASLMIRFYDSLMQPQTAAAALRQAQIASLNEHPHPFFWASYLHTIG